MADLRRLTFMLVIIACQMAVFPSASAESYKTIDWTELLPDSDLDALTQGPEIMHNTPEVPVESPIANQARQAANNDFEKALVSTRVRPEFDKQSIRIPGFIVPLEFDEAQQVTEFFLVPYYGACIHVPPPPPNQLIHVVYPKGFKLDDLYLPFWIEGALHTRLIKKTVSGGDAVSAYAMTVDSIEMYQE